MCGPLFRTGYMWRNLVLTRYQRCGWSANRFLRVALITEEANNTYCSQNLVGLIYHIDEEDINKTCASHKTFRIKL